MFFKSLTIVAGVLASGVLFSAPLRAAPKGSNPQEERLERERIQQAERDVKDARGKLDAAQKEMTAAAQAAKQAQADRDHAVVALKRVKDGLEHKLGSQAGWTEAVAQQAAAKTAYEKVVEPLLTALKADSKYRRAASAAASAKEEYSAGELTDQQLRERLVLPGTLERAALSADSQATAARAKWDDASQKVAEAKIRLEKLMDSDPEYKEAQKKLSQASKHLDDAKHKHEKEQKDFASANNKLQQELAQLNRAKTADRNDDKKDAQALQQRNKKKK